jgi:hypothetical protein
MANNTNLYLDKILLEHPTAVWTLDDDFSATGPFVELDSFYTPTPIVIPTQNTSNGGGYMGFNTTGNHGLVVGDFIVIAGVTPTAYNGEYKVLGITDSDSFYVAGSITGNITVAGTLTKKYLAHELTAYNSSKYTGYVWSTSPLVSKTPMVYGSSKSQFGSFMLPASGFLSEDGRYGQYTFETWVKIKKSNNTDKYKLIGLLNTDSETDDGNGLYYNDTSFILKIGRQSDEVFIKQMNKPMLIQITYSQNLASLFVNGEELISLGLEEEDLQLMKNPTDTLNYLVLSEATFDCPAIYPYKLSASQIKMHYALGQAVEMPETINKSYGGATVSIDFPSARYASNLNYPMNAEWKSGIHDNIDVKRYSISNKQFGLPVFNFYNPQTQETSSKEDFISELAQNNQTWKPKYGVFSSVNSNLEFESLDILNDKLEGFYIDCYSTSLPSTTEKTVFKIVNKYNTNYLKITLQYVGSNIEVKYKFKYNSETELVVTKLNPHYQASSPETYNLLIGLSIDKFAEEYSNDISNFLNNLEDLSMFVLGDNDLSLDTTPDITIRKIKFLTAYQLQKLDLLLIDSDGTFFYPADAYVPTNIEAILNSEVGNYELKYIQNKKVYNTSYIDNSLFYVDNYFSVGTSGYWKDDAPLTHFAKYVKDEDLNDVYTFSNIQFNIDYDAPTINTESISQIKYFDTSKSNVKTYITFEDVSSNYREDSYFTNGIKKISQNRVVLPDANWQTTKYEVVDGTIIYPPTSVNISSTTPIDISTLKIVTHIEISVSDTTNNKVEIKLLELCSQALAIKADIENPVYTKYSTEIIPYTYKIVSGNKVYDYSGVKDAINPFIIEKRTSPYLSLERLSGIRLLELDSPVSGVYRGIRIPLNEKQNLTSKLSSVQMFIYYDALADADNSNLEMFSFLGKELFNIVSSDKTLSTIVGTLGTPVSGPTNSLPISTRNDLSEVEKDIQYYINGELQANPVLKTNEWIVLTIVFPKSLSFDNFVGEFNITGPISIDNIVFYGFTDREFLSGQTNNTWEQIKTPYFGTAYEWQDWSSSTWLELFPMSVSLGSHPISPSKIYGSFTGTNIFYPGEYDRSKNVSVNDTEYNFYGNYTSEKYIYSAD